MATTVSPGPAARHLDCLDVPLRPAKARLNSIELSWLPKIGAALRRAFQLANLSQKEVAALIGRDTAQVARWLSGQERPQFDVLFAVEALRGPLVIALAGLADDIDVTTTISVRRRA